MYVKTIDPMKTSCIKTIEYLQFKHSTIKTIGSNCSPETIFICLQRMSSFLFLPKPNENLFKGTITYKNAKTGSPVLITTQLYVLITTELHVSWSFSSLKGDTNPHENKNKKPVHSDRGRNWRDGRQVGTYY